MEAAKTKYLLKLGIILLVIGLSFSASTLYRSGSPNSFAIGVNGFTSINPNSWSAEPEKGQLSSILLAPRNLRMEVKANTTIDIYIFNDEGIRLWANQGVLQPVWSSQGTTQQVFKLQIDGRGAYYFLVYNPTSLFADYEINAMLYGYEKDLLLVSIASTAIGLTITMVSMLGSIIKKQITLPYNQ